MKTTRTRRRRRLVALAMLLSCSMVFNMFSTAYAAWNAYRDIVERPRQHTLSVDTTLYKTSGSAPVKLEDSTGAALPLGEVQVGEPLPLRGTAASTGSLNAVARVKVNIELWDTSGSTARRISSITTNGENAVTFTPIWATDGSGNTLWHADGDWMYYDGKLMAGGSEAVIFDGVNVDIHNLESTSVITYADGTTKELSALVFLSAQSSRNLTATADDTSNDWSVEGRVQVDVEAVQALKDAAQSAYGLDTAKADTLFANLKDATPSDPNPKAWDETSKKTTDVNVAYQGTMSGYTLNVTPPLENDLVPGVASTHDLTFTNGSDSPANMKVDINLSQDGVSFVPTDGTHTKEELFDAYKTMLKNLKVEIVDVTDPNSPKTLVNKSIDASSVLPDSDRGKDAPSTTTKLPIGDLNSISLLNMPEGTSRTLRVNLSYDNPEEISSIYKGVNPGLMFSLSGELNGNKSDDGGTVVPPEDIEKLNRQQYIFVADQTTGERYDKNSGVSISPSQPIDITGKTFSPNVEVIGGTLGPSKTTGSADEVDLYVPEGAKVIRVGVIYNTEPGKTDEIVKIIVHTDKSEVTTEEIVDSSGEKQHLEFADQTTGTVIPPAKVYNKDNPNVIYNADGLITYLPDGTALLSGEIQMADVFTTELCTYNKNTNKIMIPANVTKYNVEVTTADQNGKTVATNIRVVPLENTVPSGNPEDTDGVAKTKDDGTRDIVVRKDDDVRTEIVEPAKVYTDADGKPLSKDEVQEVIDKLVENEKLIVRSGDGSPVWLDDDYNIIVPANAIGVKVAFDEPDASGAIGGITVTPIYPKDDPVDPVDPVDPKPSPSPDDPKKSPDVVIPSNGGGSKGGTLPKTSDPFVQVGISSTLALLSGVGLLLVARRLRGMDSEGAVMEG